MDGENYKNTKITAALVIGNILQQNVKLAQLVIYM